MEFLGWESFLNRWNAEWAAAPSTREEAEEDGEGGGLEEMIEEGLGFPPVGEERIGALEQRLGATLPPSYRSFLAASDGWRRADSAVYLMGTVDGVHWHGDPMGFQANYEDRLSANSSAQDVVTAGMWSRALQLSLDSDMTDLLLDPGDVNAEGEWALYVYRGWSGDCPRRFESFGDYMRAMFADFHSDNGADPGFVNDTTRALDASLDRARLACLAGDDIDRQLEVLTEAMSYGRPVARKLHDQLTSMLGRGGYLHGHGRLDDPLVGREFMPLAAVDHAQGTHRDDDWFLRPLHEDDQARGAELLERIRERRYVYESPGPFGEAIVAAREQASRGDTDGAWRTVEAALPDWEPYGDDHIAPVGLLADPLLGPIVTPERGRRVLSTPRGAGRTAPAAGPGPLDEAVPDGLAWLADGPRSRHAYRFVLAEGVSPRELAERLGDGTLLPPHNQLETDPWHNGARGTPDRVGACATEAAADGESGSGWSFAFRNGLEPVQPKRLHSLGEKASRSGGRSVLVCCVIRGGTSEASSDIFHFSYWEDGRECYGFTVTGGVTERSGDFPLTLDPRRFFPEVPDRKAADERVGERRALTAVSETFGLSLPRFAIRHGRLPAVMTEPVIRQSGTGGGIQGTLLAHSARTPPSAP
ncbi:SMI1/KNR4 family protein [Streptomyces niveus]|uniref:SMI1/KNR4 family protein n=1 Tax=Streptomyces niveus TaxID=193462 RepID=UPI00365D946B